MYGVLQYLLKLLSSRRSVFPARLISRSPQDPRTSVAPWTATSLAASKVSSRPDRPGKGRAERWVGQSLSVHRRGYGCGVQRRRSEADRSLGTGVARVLRIVYTVGTRGLGVAVRFFRRILSCSRLFRQRRTPPPPPGWRTHDNRVLYRTYCTYRTYQTRGLRGVYLRFSYIHTYPRLDHGARQTLDPAHSE